MLNVPNWSETESKIYQRPQPMVFVGACFFTFVAVLLYSDLLQVAQPAALPRRHWLVMTLLLFAGCALLGQLLVKGILSVRIRHAESGVFPDVPSTPLVVEGSIVHGRLTHELCNVDHGWVFRPAPHLWRSDTLLISFSLIPALTVFAALLAYRFQQTIGWVAATACAIILALACGGTVALLTLMTIRSGLGRLWTLRIPSQGEELELESAERPTMDQAFASEGLNWSYRADGEGQQLIIPKAQMIAVQLCPWKFELSDSSTSAVQGLLVLHPSGNGVNRRLPILLTSDFAGSARLMRELADVLQVPFLFNADAAGWKAEAIIAKTRPPLRCGGMIT